jgi:ectoine hydroxylase-related dioxygenase (phytanoyl-CoA dioxygenase family)
MGFDEFHVGEVPGLLASGQGEAAARDLGPGRTLALRHPDGRAYTYRSTGADIEVVPGEIGDLVVELAPDAFADLVGEAWSVFGLLYADRVKVCRGDFGAFARWEAPLQALWFGRPVYGEEAVVALVDRAGDRLNLRRSFTLDDDGGELRHFLSTAGFLVLRGVFGPDEIADLNAVVAEELAGSAPGDGRSWWATRRDGTDVCCRLTYMASRSPVAARLARDSRVANIAALADPELLPCTDRLDGMSVVIKNPDVVAGLSDLPWHRDCGVGGHRVLCPGLNVGVQLDRADADNGQLHFLAGSHRHAAQQGPPTDLDGVPTVAVDADPGDVTVHFSHLLHAAPPPAAQDAGRKALYLGYHLPAAFDVVGPGQSYNDVLVTRDAGRVKSPDEVVAG